MGKNLYRWGNDLVIVLKDIGDKALVKFINSDQYKKGHVRDIPWYELKKIPPKKQLVPPFAPLEKDSFNDTCPTCKTPDSISGIECPGCGFKEWLNSQN